MAWLLKREFINYYRNKLNKKGWEVNMNKKIIMVVIAAIVVIALIIGLVIWINRDNTNIQIEI